MERSQGIAARRAESVVEPVEPEVSVLRPPAPPRGRAARPRRADRQDDATIDAKAGVRIVDWRHAPVSQIYYRYEEGTDYEETFGEREVEGTVLARRTVTIDEGDAAPRFGAAGRLRQARRRAGARDRHRGDRALGRPGQGRAPGGHAGMLGAASTRSRRLRMAREDRHLPEIAALLDPRQFELISSPTGASSSSRAAPAAARPPSACIARVPRVQRAQRFTADKMLVIVGSPALRAYISEVLPALGIDGLPVETVREWIREQRKKRTSPGSTSVEEDTPSVVTRYKTHPS
jgi:DNA helicase-2/ATP-dependent DNA helicase PcrA